MEDFPRPACRTVGTTLREARERRGCTLHDISTATNISIHVLEAIERGDLAQVPGGIFVRAHLRAYAIQVGLNPEYIVAEYCAQHESAREDDGLRELRIRCANRGARRGASWIRPALLAAALMLIIYHMFSSGSAESPLVDPTMKSVPAADEPHPRKDVPVARMNDRVMTWSGVESPKEATVRLDDSQKADPVSRARRSHRAMIARGANSFHPVDAVFLG